MFTLSDYATVTVTLMGGTFDLFVPPVNVMVTVA